LPRKVLRRVTQSKMSGMAHHRTKTASKNIEKGTTGQEGTGRGKLVGGGKFTGNLKEKKYLHREVGKRPKKKKPHQKSTTFLGKRTKKA